MIPEKADVYTVDLNNFPLKVVFFTFDAPSSKSDRLLNQEQKNQHRKLGAEETHQNHRFHT